MLKNVIDNKSEKIDLFLTSPEYKKYNKDYEIDMEKDSNLMNILYHNIKINDNDQEKISESGIITNLLWKHGFNKIFDTSIMEDFDSDSFTDWQNRLANFKKELEAKVRPQTAKECSFNLQKNLEKKVDFLKNLNQDQEKKSAYKKISQHYLDFFEISGNSIDIWAARQDAWSLYLGMPQKHGTFEISNAQPIGSKDDIYYYKLPKFEQKIKKALDIKSIDPQSYLGQSLKKLFTANKRGEKFIIITD